MPRAPAALAELERRKAEPGSARRQVELLRLLSGERRLAAKDLSRLHEVLLFLRTYPQDGAVARESERLLAAFGSRPDLLRHRDALADTGIVRTEVHYPFFQATASRLVARYGSRITVDWDAGPSEEALERRLAFMVTDAEAAGVDDAPLLVREWVERLRGRGESDAAFLVRRFDALLVPDRVREQLFDELELPLRLDGGPGLPSRTTARWRGARTPLAFGAPRQGRPDLRLEADRPPGSIRSVGTAAGRELVELARDAMAVRSRDLDAFAYADPKDVRVADCGDGLCFAILGVVPERRLLLEGVYAFLTIRNGVPIGYVLVSALFGSSEIAYNVFETWRGAEAAWIYGRVLATARAIFGSDTFTVYPYQLGGEGNDEGLASGAWWFYQKLGFRARDAGVLRTMERELRRLSRRTSYRSSRATLAGLAEHNVYFGLGPSRDDVIGVIPFENVALGVTDLLSRRFGSARDAGVDTCADEVGSLLGPRAWKSAGRRERDALRRWSPLLRALRGLDRWSNERLAAAFRVFLSKGGRRESDFVRAFDAHAALRGAVLDLARRTTS